MRSPYTGSGGPMWNLLAYPPSYGWSEGMRRYGLPYDDVPGISDYDQLRDPQMALRMGQAMRDRMARGDVVHNLAATTLLTVAYQVTGEEKYRRWVIDYVDAWVDRARRNGDSPTGRRAGWAGPGPAADPHRLTLD